MTDDSRIQVGSVVQIDPAHDARFGACFLVVTEVKTWGVQGYVTVPGADRGNAFYRVGFERIVYIGQAEWIRAEPASVDAVREDVESPGATPRGSKSSSSGDPVQD